jgi:hypothetical protein
LAKPTQQNTPIEITLSPTETVTVIDPRHPLYGRTLPLLGITNKQYLGRCCVVWLLPGVERLVPLAATDLAADPICLYPLPLNLSAVEQLLATFMRIKIQPAEETEDAGIKGSTQSGDTEPNRRPGQVEQRDHSGSNLGSFKPTATTPGLADPGTVVPPGVAKQPDGGEG